MTDAIKIKDWTCFERRGRPNRSAQSKDQQAAVDYHPDVGLTCTTVSEQIPPTFIIPPAVLHWLTTVPSTKETSE